MEEIEELQARSIIEFPEPFEIDGVRAMFLYLAQRSPYIATLYLEQTEHYGTNEKGTSQTDVTKLSGRIREKENVMRSAPFRLDRKIHSKTDKSIFPRLSFQTTPGYSLAEHSEIEKKVWDGTRRAIEDYFKNL